jgi:protein phosphatase
LAAENRDFTGMGTTLALIFAPRDQIHICHVGDSRVYRLREGRLELLTMDHSWVNEQLQRHIITEDEARNHRWRNVITRALGNRSDLEIDLKTIPAQPGDLFMLCSDGLTGMLRDEEIARIIGRYRENLDSACDALVEAANQAGGQDNISVILAEVQP